jgi:hypothetical protein
MKTCVYVSMLSLYLADCVLSGTCPKCGYELR